MLFFELIFFFVYIISLASLKKIPISITNAIRHRKMSFSKKEKRKKKGNEIVFKKTLLRK